MSKLKDVLRDVGYCSVGAAAMVWEVGSKVVRTLVRKGEQTLSEHQDVVDDLKRRAKDIGESIRNAAEKAAEKSEPPETPVVEPVAEPAAEEPARPVAPDVIYHAGEPVPVVEEPEAPVADPAEEPAVPEKPENTVNG